MPLDVDVPPPPEPSPRVTLGHDDPGPVRRPPGRSARRPSTPRARIAHRRAPRPAPRTVDAFAVALGVGLGAVVGLGVSAESSSLLGQAGGWATAAGRMAGLVGAYLMLIVVLLAGRIPVVERTLGQDLLMRWHRRLAPWPLVIIALHGALITIGYAQLARTGVLHQFWLLLTTYPGVLPGTAAFVLLIAAGVTSARIALRRMRYETWWIVHLYTYLALALAFSHQLATGASFIGHPAARIFWTALWIATAGTVAVYRILLPLWRTALHGLRVVSVQPIAPGVASVTVRGRFVGRLPVSGGQFVQWRILARGLWWQAHPYSLSALPDPPYLRFTVKDVGDHSGVFAGLKPGTRIAIEGPYGAFTRDARTTDRILLIGAGIGITPLRALLEDLPRHVDVAMIVRARDEAAVILGDELRRLVAARRGRVHELLGSREQMPVDAASLGRLVPDLRRRDVYLCGPDGFTREVVAALGALGVPDHRIHHERFAF
jgi:ferredoxin-NADP reductase